MWFMWITFPSSSMLNGRYSSGNLNLDIVYIICVLYWLIRHFCTNYSYVFCTYCIELLISCSCSICACSYVQNFAHYLLIDYLSRIVRKKQLATFSKVNHVIESHSSVPTKASSYTEEDLEPQASGWQKKEVTKKEEEVTTKETWWKCFRNKSRLRGWRLRRLTSTPLTRRKRCQATSHNLIFFEDAREEEPLHQLNQPRR